MRVSSASLAGSFGGGIAVPILSRLIARAVCGDISLPSKRLACSSQLLSWVRKRSLDLAAISLLSSVMQELEIHCAAVISGYIAMSSPLTRSMNWSAVSSLGMEESVEGSRLHAESHRAPAPRSEEHTTELQSLMCIHYTVISMKKKTNRQ